MKLFGLRLLAASILLVSLIILALCVDYGLFILTRFAEERRKGAPLEVALQTATLYSGHVILVSGTVLCLAWVSQMLFPDANGLHFLAQGLGCGLGVIASVFTSVTLLPCLIAQFPGFFDQEEAVTAESPQQPRSDFTEKMWRSWGLLITRKPWVYVVPMIAFAVMSPAVWRLSHLNFVSMDVNQAFAQNTPEWQNYERLNEKYPKGEQNPTLVLLRAVPIPDLEAISTKVSTYGELEQIDAGTEEQQPQDGDTVRVEVTPDGRLASRPIEASVLRDSPAEHAPVQRRQQKRRTTLGGGSLQAAAVARGDEHQPSKSGAFFERACEVAVKGVQSSDMIPTRGALSIAFNPATGDCVSWEDADAILKGSGSLPTQYRRAWRHMVSPDNSSTLILFRPDFYPYGDKALSFINDMREKHLPGLKGPLEMGGNHEAELHFASFFAGVVDTELNMSKYFLWIFSFCVVLMFLTISFLFGAAALPLRLLITNLLPQAFIYGCATLIYKDGLLDSLGIDQLKGSNGIYFLVPYNTNLILLGLALDYEIFLFARVWERRNEGYDNRSAIVQALAETGGVITIAGIVMTFAFLSLLLGPGVANNQVGFVLSMGVLIDTVLVRGLIVPCVLCWGPQFNYWPTKMPPATIIIKDDGQPGVASPEEQSSFMRAAG